MMRIILAFLILTVSILLGIQLSRDPGYVLISINHWIIESTLWFTVLSMLLFFILAYAFIRMLHKIVCLPQALEQWNSNRLTQKAQSKTRMGFIEYSEGYWKKASNHLVQAIPNSESPLLNYLTAAHAAQNMGDNQARDLYLREAQQAVPEAKFAVELTQAQLQIENAQWEQALATLNHLHALAPKHPYVLKLLMNLYQKLNDWPHLLALLPEIQKNRVLSDEELIKLQKLVYLQILKNRIKQNQIEAVSEFFNALPRYLVQDPELLAEYSLFILAQQQPQQAETLLRQALKKKVSAPLLDLYGLLPGQTGQLSFAESLLKKNTPSANLYLCLGRLCMAQHLWGKAKYYLEQSNELRPAAETYAALGKLHEQLHQALEAGAQYKKGLELVIKQGN